MKDNSNLPNKLVEENISENTSSHNHDNNHNLSSNKVYNNPLQGRKQEEILQENYANLH